MVRSRSRERKKLLVAYPECAYCGGLRPATELDHVPPIQMFPKRQRPKGLETPSCTACNRGAREAESLASLLASVHLGTISESDVQHWKELVGHLANNYPALLQSLKPTTRQLREVRRLSSELGTDLGAFDLRGPSVSHNLLLFGAKCGLALHWHQKKAPLPPDGRVVVFLFSNDQAIQGDVPQHLFDQLPDPKTLQQGKKHAADRFQYASRATVDGASTAHWVTFGQAFAYNLFVGPRLKTGDVDASHILAPGCLAPEAG